MPLRTAVLRTRFKAKDTHCPATALVTGALKNGRTCSAHGSQYRRTDTDRFLCMLLIAVLRKLPLESGPRSTASPALTDPLFKMPSTTVPTYGTDL